MVSGLMVSPAHRSRGIGSALLSKAIAFFREYGVRYYTLYTAAANEGALAFYRRHGMTALHLNLLSETDAPDQT